MSELNVEFIEKCIHSSKKALRNGYLLDTDFHIKKVVVMLIYWRKYNLRYNNLSLFDRKTCKYKT